MCKPKVFRFTLLFTSSLLFSIQFGRKVLAVRVYGLRSEHLNAHQTQTQDNNNNNQTKPINLGLISCHAQRPSLQTSATVTMFSL